MSRRMDAITKQLEGITNFFQSIENARTDIQGGKGEVSSDYANLYSSPMRTKKQDSNAAGTVENGNVEESVVESNQSDTVQECHKFVYGNLRIDGKLTKPLKSENESKGKSCRSSCQILSYHVSIALGFNGTETCTRLSPSVSEFHRIFQGF